MNERSEGQHIWWACLNVVRCWTFYSMRSIAYRTVVNAWIVLFSGIIFALVSLDFLQITSFCAAIFFLSLFVVARLSFVFFHIRIGNYCLYSIFLWHCQSIGFFLVFIIVIARHFSSSSRVYTVDMYMKCKIHSYSSESI